MKKSLIGNQEVRGITKDNIALFSKTVVKNYIVFLTNTKKTKTLNFTSDIFSIIIQQIQTFINHFVDKIFNNEIISFQAYHNKNTINSQIELNQIGIMLKTFKSSKIFLKFKKLLAECLYYKFRKARNGNNTLIINAIKFSKQSLFILYSIFEYNFKKIISGFYL